MKRKILTQQHKDNISIGVSISRRSYYDDPLNLAVLRICKRGHEKEEFKRCQKCLGEARIRYRNRMKAWKELISDTIIGLKMSGWVK